MKKPYQLLVIIFFAVLFFPKEIYAKCVIINLGGSKDWISLAPGISTDISIDVHSAVKKESNKTDCQVVNLSNDKEASFYEKLSFIKTLGSNTKIHLAFTDHGTPTDRNLQNSRLITGQGEYTTYGKFLDFLNTNLPKDAQLTFQTNMCWPNISEALSESKLIENHIVCGSSSTINQDMSWNAREISFEGNGDKIGPYGAVGLNHLNEIQEKENRIISTYEFHKIARRGDVGNISRKPGFLSSVAYANSILIKKNLYDKNLNESLYTLFDKIKWNEPNSFDQILRIDNDELKKDVLNAINGNCQNEKNIKSPLQSFLDNLRKIFNQLENTELSKLPLPFRQDAQNSLVWFKKNKNQIAEIIGRHQKEQALFKQKYRAGRKEKYDEIESLWNQLQNKQTKELKNFYFHFRTLQEGKIINTFQENATPSEKNRFNRLLECEKRPIF